jgi:DMATS type aromatic prenyltransferase
MSVMSETATRRFFVEPFSNLPPLQDALKETDVPIPLSAVTAVWHQVDSKFRHSLSFHGRYWWWKSGYALAVLLYNAEYSSLAQYQSLAFFVTVIAPSLGAANEPPLGAKAWSSFMTDDGNPVELSWAWGTGTKLPTIRFSIEPVGIHAGTPTDPENRHATSRFRQALLRSLTRTNVEWFDHFDAQLNCYDIANGLAHEGHSSQIFYAFDLAEDGITSKAYFFPGFRAGATGETNLSVISQAIATAPYCVPENLEALSVFQKFATSSSGLALEMDMLAIDLIDPMASRLKIYFRSRETSFTSVQHIMTLGNRTTTPELVQGVRNLKQLWDAVLERKGSQEDTPLPASDHRTAGLLYNVEFRLGSALPKVKIYIPVRHYVSSDMKIIHGLGDYLYGVSGHGGRYLPAYVHSLSTIL